MRVDKYLKVAHILKRWTVSKELALNERIEVNGKVAKPSHEIHVGDEIRVVFGKRVLKVRVLSTEEVKKKKDASDMYEVIEEGFVSWNYN